MIVLLNLSAFGFSFVFHDKAKRTQQGNLLVTIEMLKWSGVNLVCVCPPRFFVSLYRLLKILCLDVVDPVFRAVLVCLSLSLSLNV